MTEIDMVLVEEPTPTAVLPIPYMGVALFFRDVEDEPNDELEAVWQAFLADHYACIALRPGAATWDTALPDSMDRPFAEAQILQHRIRLGLEAAPACYIGFAQGTEPASLLGLEDPTARSVVLMRGGGIPPAVPTLGQPRILLAWSEQDEAATAMDRQEQRDAWATYGGIVEESLVGGRGALVTAAHIQAIRTSLGTSRRTA